MENKENNMKLSQCEKILIAMLSNKDKEIWMASDFQSGKYFIGYEASARMSELLKKYPEFIIVGRRGKFRTLAINWGNVTKEVKDLI